MRERQAAAVLQGQESNLQAVLLSQGVAVALPLLLVLELVMEALQAKAVVDMEKVVGRV
jgi:hypothetical protein